MAESSQEYTISHTGTVLGSEYITRASNQTSPQRPSAVFTMECPKKFDSIEYVGRRDATRFVPRTTETFDGDGSKTTFDLTADVQPVAGEEQIVDQDYPAVVGTETSNGQLTVASVDYAANSVTFESAPASGTDNVKIYPIITEGDVQYRGLNQFGQVEGHVADWATPAYRWHDYEQLKAGREVNLSGSVEWGRYEKVEVLLDSPRSLTWEDADFPEGQYVSTFEQDVVINLG